MDAPGTVVFMILYMISFMVLLFTNSHACTKSPLVHKTQMAILFSEQCLRLLFSVQAFTAYYLAYKHLQRFEDALEPLPTFARRTDTQALLW